MFPIAPLKKLPANASATDKNILGPKITELINGANDLDQRLVALTARVTALETATVPVPPTEPPVEPVPIPPEPTPIPPTDAIGIILALLGPTKSVTETAALGGDFARYDQIFLEKLPTTNTWEDNYYDRGVVYYARHARDGDPKWLQMGHDIVLKYRDQYLVPNTYKSSPHWSQVRGLELHYRLTGDELSRTAVAGIYANALAGFARPLWGPKAAIEDTGAIDSENRIQARVLHAALSSYRMGASFTGEYGAFDPSMWPAELRKILNMILSTQKADGSWNWYHLCGGQLNYMVGMLNDVLIEYWNSFEQDARIPGSVERANEYLWSTQWLAADQAFKYCSVLCAANPSTPPMSVGGPDAAGDLNGLLIASYGWLFKQTGNSIWRTRGDAIMAGLVSDRWASNYSGSKNFNQAFAEAYRYLGWR